MSSKKPFRPNNVISQSFNSGIVEICRVVDNARPGMQPKKVLLPRCLLHYENRNLGINRYYAAKQANIEISRVIRVPKNSLVMTGDYAVTEDGNQFAITLLQDVIGVYPPCFDLTLSAISQRLEVNG